MPEEFENNPSDSNDVSDKLDDIIDEGDIVPEEDEGITEKQEISLSPNEQEKLLKKITESVKIIPPEQISEEEKGGESQEFFGTDEASARLLVSLVDPNKVNFNTIIDREEFQALVQLEIFGNFLKKETKINILEQLAQIYKELRVSVDGLGREQIITVLSYVNSGGMGAGGRAGALLKGIYGGLK